MVMKRNTCLAISLSVFVMCLPVLPCFTAAAQDTATPSAKEIASKTFTLKGDSLWTDTGITLEPGQRISVTAEGTMQYADAKQTNGPDGLPRNFKDLIRILPFNDAGRGALIGRIGDTDIA